MLSTSKATRGGFMIAEAVVGLVIISCILGGVMLALHVQTRAAERTVRRTRARLLLEGEMAVMRGLPASEFQPCEHEVHHPVLDPPESLDNIHVYKTITISRDKSLATVTLHAIRDRENDSKQWISITEKIFLGKGPR